MSASLSNIEVLSFYSAHVNHFSRHLSAVLVAWPLCSLLSSRPFFQFKSGPIFTSPATPMRYNYCDGWAQALTHRAAEQCVRRPPYAAPSRRDLDLKSGVWNSGTNLRQSFNSTRLFSINLQHSGPVISKSFVVIRREATVSSSSLI
jgi:hypothetical protein